MSDDCKRFQKCSEGSSTRPTVELGEVFQFDCRICLLNFASSASKLANMRSNVSNVASDFSRV